VPEASRFNPQMLNAIEVAAMAVLFVSFFIIFESEWYVSMENRF
jgi:hypothetical protein